jgi:hypothetical protein
MNPAQEKNYIRECLAMPDRQMRLQGAQLALFSGFRYPDLIPDFAFALFREIGDPRKQNGVIESLVGALVRTKADEAVAEINRLFEFPMEWTVQMIIGKTILHDGDWRYKPAILKLLDERSTGIISLAEACIGRHAPRNAPLPDAEIPARYRWRVLDKERAVNWLGEHNIPIDPDGKFFIHRTASSPNQRGDRYLVGETYYAPIFSYDETEDCAPGLHVATDAWLWKHCEAHLPWIVVQAHISDLLVPGDELQKARVRKFTVIQEREPIKQLS